MQGSEKFAIRVGAALSVLLIAAVVIVLRVDFADLGPSIRVRIYLKHPGPLKALADVQLAGRKIGRVDSITLVTANQARSPEHLLHPAGGVVLSMLLRKKYLPWVRTNSELFVNAKGLIGESYLEVAPPPATEEMLRPLRDGDKVRGIDPARMEEIIVTSFLNAKRFGALLRELEPSRNALRSDLEALGRTLASLMQEEAAPPFGESIGVVRSELGTLGEKVSSESLPSVSQLQRQSRRLAAEARKDVSTITRALDALNDRLATVKNRVPTGLWTKVESATADARATVARLEATASKADELVEEVASGIGTVGALMNDKEFSDDAKKVGRYIKRHPWEIVARPIDN
ncbi:MAG: MCE family protein [Myxococcales bacterium]|nr:MCE family protein [Myxococcales bacterium]